MVWSLNSTLVKCHEYVFRTLPSSSSRKFNGYRYKRCRSHTWGLWELLLNMMYQLVILTSKCLICSVESNNFSRLLLGTFFLEFLFLFVYLFVCILVADTFCLKNENCLENQAQPTLQWLFFLQNEQYGKAAAKLLNLSSMEQHPRRKLVLHFIFKEMLSFYRQLYLRIKTIFLLGNWLFLSFFKYIYMYSALNESNFCVKHHSTYRKILSLLSLVIYYSSVGPAHYSFWCLSRSFPTKQAQNQTVCT